MFDLSGALIDSVLYETSYPWPSEADGEGYTLELKNYDLDNSIVDSWYSSFIVGGTPGKKNSTEEMEIEAVKNSIMLFPNPFDEVVTLSINYYSEDSVIFKLYNCNGQLVNETKLQINFGSNLFHLDTSELASGVYYCFIETKKLRTTKKIVKLK
ncbi:MAG: T9SS type A sorting domain-containing protein [Candidatus Delongbacteria bacterium]|nr:T9SS type A sorting domain-containing protein [Candidatus Delongbacteria bacterium]MBN2833568.1 T9SS type A sorting domain-containing protein [Candidatus Delongbacteria bacterium]